MHLPKTTEAMHQPFRCKVRRRAHGEHARRLPLREAGGPKRDAIKGVPDYVEVLAACIGDDEALALAIEELEPEFQLQRLHLVADRSLSDEQFLGCPREALMPSRRFESL
jgi:hypothetical protein